MYLVAYEQLLWKSLKLAKNGDLMRIVAVDPGASGAIAVVDHGVPTAVYDMPTYQVKMATAKYRKQRGGGFKLDEKGRRIRYYPKRTTVCPIGVATLIADPSVLGGRTPEDAIVLLEKVEGRGDDGAVGAFKFGQAYSSVEAAILMAGFVPVYVYPAAWKRELGIDLKNKVAALHLARAMFGRACELSAAKHDGRGDALLMTYFASRRMEAASSGGAPWPPDNGDAGQHFSSQLEVPHEQRMSAFENAVR